MFVFAFFYFLLAILLYILALPFVFYKLKTPKYKNALKARFFLKNNPPFEENKITFHACSLGEVKSLEPFVSYYGAKEVNISTITNTGFKEANKLSKNTRYLPFEVLIPFWLKKSKVLVVLEAELWFMLFFIAKRQNTKTILINARISDKSYKSYKRFSWVYKKIFSNIDVVFAQSQKDKERLVELGAKNIKVCGNIKTVMKIEQTKIYKKPNSRLLVAASTHKNEEKLILDAYDKSFGNLILAPRHPERFSEVEKLAKEYAKKNNLSFSFFSKRKDFEANITLLDKIGELVNVYAISDVVILGGAFEPIGGHNPLEPAKFNNIVLSGKNIFNQKALFSCLENYFLIEPKDLKRNLEKIKESKNMKNTKIKNIGSIKPIIGEINGED